MNDFKFHISNSSRSLLLKLRVVIVTCFFLIFFLSIVKLYLDQQNIEYYILNIFKNNISSPVQESLIINLVKNFNNNFELNLANSGEVCSPFNCYEISYMKMYVDLFFLVVVLSIIFMTIHMFIKSTQEKSLSSILSQISVLKKVLNGQKIDRTSLVGEIHEVLSLVELNQAHREFFDHSKSIGHDLKSPIETLKTICQLNKFSEKDYEILFNECINRLDEISSNLLRKDENAISEIHICNFFERLITSKRVEFPGIEQEICLNDKSNGAKLRFNNNNLYNVFSNLLNNSIQARIANSIRINLTIETSNSFLAIKLKDSGKGFPSSILKDGVSIYNTKGKSGGSGLGLYFAKKIVLESGGKFSISNCEKTGGAIIYIQLPLI